MVIKISKDFSDTPGARYYKDGDFSGEEFYDKILEPRFIQALDKNENLIINLDDCYGFASSFISESFGRLSVKFGREPVKNIIKIISEQDPLLEEQIISIIEDPDGKSRR